MQTTVAGNYPKIGPDTRAPSIRKAITQFQLGLIPEAELHRVQEEVTKEILADQIELGVDIITDGHVRWDDPQTRFASGITGFELTGMIRYFDTNTYYRQPSVVHDLEWQGPITLEEYRFAAHNSSVPVKAVILGPYSLAKQSLWPHYSSLRAVTLDLAAILNMEARALEAAGAPIIQIDEPAILFNKQDFDLFAESMSILSDGISTSLALYSCFGDISEITEKYFALPFDTIGLDFTRGSPNYAALAKFPSSKTLGFGIMNARNTRLETVDEVISGIDSAIEHISGDKIVVSPSCGLEFLPRRNAYRKLQRMVEAVTTVREKE